MVGRLLVAGAAVAEIVALDDPRLLEQPHRPVDGGDRDVRVQGMGPAVELLDIGMVMRGRQHAGHHPALVGHAHALFRAEVFDAVHGVLWAQLRGSPEDSLSRPGC